MGCYETTLYVSLRAPRPHGVPKEQLLLFLNGAVLQAPRRPPRTMGQASSGGPSTSREKQSVDDVYEARMQIALKRRIPRWRDNIKYERGNFHTTPREARWACCEVFEMG